ncbi:MAG: T9SS type A sorting domain-containing protein [Ignavibacteria bacterium]
MKKNLLFFLALLSLISLRVYAQPLSPILVEPPKDVDVAIAPVLLDWNDVAGAQCYRVEIYTDTTSPDKFEGSCNAPASHFEFPIAQTEMDTRYYWRVFACSPQGWSEPSVYFNFRTQAPDAAGSIGNLTDGVIDLIADELIPQNFGNQLIHRLEKAELRVNQNNEFLALLEMVLFKARVFILRFSNHISESTFTSLNYSADGVIDLISDIQGRPVNNPKVEDYLVPKNFEVKQNYPNPFNPTTTIEYSIPKDAAVSLKIYDVLGKEVATLVNDQKAAGTYILNWNASSYSSGIYFYRVNAGEFTETKKMFLVK